MVLTLESLESIVYITIKSYKIYNTIEQNGWSISPNQPPHPTLTSILRGLHLRGAAGHGVRGRGGLPEPPGPGHGAGGGRGGSGETGARGARATREATKLRSFFAFFDVFLESTLG